MARLKYRVHMIDSFNQDPIKCKCGWYMGYKSTYNPLEGIHNDREYRKSCLDKCTVCGYTEAVPEWVLDELALGKRGDGYVMACPKCDEKMIEK